MGTLATMPRTLANPCGAVGTMAYLEHYTAGASLTGSRAFPLTIDQALRAGRACPGSPTETLRRPRWYGLAGWMRRGWSQRGYFPMSDEDAEQVHRKVRGYPRNAIPVNIDLVKVQASPDKTRLYPLKIHPLDQTRRDRNEARRLRLRVDVMSRVELLSCEQSAVAVRTVAWLASVKLAFLQWLDTTGWTRDRGNLL